MYVFIFNLESSVFFPSCVVCYNDISYEGELPNPKVFQLHQGHDIKIIFVIRVTIEAGMLSISFLINPMPIWKTTQQTRLHCLF